MIESTFGSNPTTLSIVEIQSLPPKQEILLGEAKRKTVDVSTKKIVRSDCFSKKPRTKS